MAQFELVVIPTARKRAESKNEIEPATEVNWQAFGRGLRIVAFCHFQFRRTPRSPGASGRIIKRLPRMVDTRLSKHSGFTLRSMGSQMRSRKWKPTVEGPEFHLRLEGLSILSFPAASSRGCAPRNLRFSALPDPYWKEKQGPLVGALRRVMKSYEGSAQTLIQKLLASAVSFFSSCCFSDSALVLDAGSDSRWNNCCIAAIICSCSSAGASFSSLVRKPAIL
jgi:hypothetical protein